MQRRQLLAAGAALLVACDRPPSKPTGLRLRWLGNNAWDLSYRGTTVLVDPWLTRFRTGTYTQGGARPDTPLSVDPATIDRYVTRADLILVCHGHYDHIADVPYLARRTGATVVGDASHCNLLRAMEVPERQLLTVAPGRRLTRGGFAVDVLHSLHSMTGNPPAVPFPGSVEDRVPPRPQTVADLVEGGTLAYRIGVPGLTLLVLSSGNFDAEALAGQHPDAVILPAGGAADYPGRLLGELGEPRWVLPSHWDDYDLPLDQPARDWGGLERLRAAVAAARPSATFVQLAHGETVHLP
jgi:L-ascorbate metabolism protein UlaG (beta-lactamase superfamily)